MSHDDTRPTRACRVVAVAQILFAPLLVFLLWRTLEPADVLGYSAMAAMSGIVLAICVHNVRDLRSDPPGEP